MNGDRVTLSPKSSLLMDYFFDEDRSFIGTTVDMGLRIEYRPTGRWTWFIEPIVEITPFATDDVPWFVRGAAHIGGKFGW
jgi:hypothetical protein